MPKISLKKIDIIVSLLVIPVCLYVFYESARWPVIDGTGNATWVPRGDAFCLLAAGFLLLVKALRGRSLTIPSRLVGADRTRVLWIVVLTGAYTAAVDYVGFITTTIPYLFGFALVLGERKWSSSQWGFPLQPISFSAQPSTCRFRGVGSIRVLNEY
jgi:hypothetical protein